MNAITQRVDRAGNILDSANPFLRFAVLRVSLLLKRFDQILAAAVHSQSIRQQQHVDAVDSVLDSGVGALTLHHKPTLFEQG